MGLSSQFSGPPTPIRESSSAQARKQASEQAFRGGWARERASKGATICRIDKTKMQHSQRTANREEITIDVMITVGYSGTYNN
jgi:hypothetical protein